MKKNFQFLIFNFKFKNLQLIPYSLSPNSGFTIIELIVSISIILLITSLSYAGYASLNKRQEVLSSGQTMKNILRDAQSRAFNGEINCNLCDCQATGGQILTGWYVDFSAKEIYGQCEPLIFDRTAFGLPPEINIIIDPVTINGILFTADPPGADENVTICLSHSLLPAGFYYKINVNRAGDISDSSALISSCP